MDWFWFLLPCLEIISGHATDNGNVEVSDDGRLLHFSPVSPSTHWIFPSIVPSAEITVGDGAVVIERVQNGSLVITMDPLSVSREAMDFAALVRCELGCDGRLEEMAFDGRCEVTKPPVCVKFIPKYTSIALCLETGKFLNESLLTNIDEALDKHGLYREVPYNVTLRC